MRWRQKFWPESENRNHNQDPYEQRKLNNSKNLHGNLLEIKDTGTREFSSSLEKEGSELAKSVQPVPFRLGDLVRVSERSLKGTKILTRMSKLFQGCTSREESVVFAV